MYVSQIGMESQTFDTMGALFDVKIDLTGWMPGPPAFACCEKFTALIQPAWP